MPDNTAVKAPTTYNRDGIEIHPASSFEGMRKAGKLAAELLDYITPFCIPGVSTEELD